MAFNPIAVISNLLRPQAKQPSKLYTDFMLWQMHGIAEDVLNESARPEYAKYVKKARENVGESATEDQLFLALEKILEKLSD